MPLAWLAPEKAPLDLWALQLVTALAEFRSLSIGFVSHQEALDTSTPMGKAMFTIIGAMAELERNVIRERVVSGLDYARTHGTKSGRGLGRPRCVFDHNAVRAMRTAGKSWRAIAAHLGVGVGTARRAHERKSNGRELTSVAMNATGAA